MPFRLMPARKNAELPFFIGPRKILIVTIYCVKHVNVFWELYNKFKQDYLCYSTKFLHNNNQNITMKGF